VVHWDVGPHNILVRGDGEPALADLQVGRLVVQAAGGGRIPSPAYAAHEVLAGRPPTPSSDVYSLGATLLYLLAGRPPFSTYDDPLLLVMIGRRPRLARTDVPPSVLAQILKAMSPRPDDRFPDAMSFAAALRRQQRDLGRPIRCPSMAVRSLRDRQLTPTQSLPRRSPTNPWRSTDLHTAVLTAPTMHSPTSSRSRLGATPSLNTSAAMPCELCGGRRLVQAPPRFGPVVSFDVRVGPVRLEPALLKHKITHIVERLVCSRICTAGPFASALMRRGNVRPPSASLG
jgi:serine/threonine protein kinase